MTEIVAQRMTAEEVTHPYNQLLKLSGNYTHKEIAAGSGLCHRTVQRIFSSREGFEHTSCRLILKVMVFLGGRLDVVSQ